MAPRGTGTFRAITPDALAEHVAERACAVPGRVRVIVDGPPPSAPGRLAAAVADLVRVCGRPASVVHADDFLRPASVRLELGHTDPDMYLDGWLDEPALRREVLDPASGVGSGMVLPRLRDPVRDRSRRDDPQPLGDDGVLLLAGSRLLGRGFAAELTVHLRMSVPALARRTPEEERWTLEAYERYATERGPEALADVLVMADHPERPALRDRDR